MKMDAGASFQVFKKNKENFFTVWKLDKNFFVSYSLSKATKNE